MNSQNSNIFIMSQGCRTLWGIAFFLPYFVEMYYWDLPAAFGLRQPVLVFSCRNDKVSTKSAKISASGGKYAKNTIKLLV